MEEDAVLAEDVPGDPHLPPVPGLHHHVVVTSGLLQATAVLVAPVALLSVPKYISNTWGELYIPILLTDHSPGGLRRLPWKGLHLCSQNLQ